jgi:phospholipid/cholesterol/gamma-HCH transport system ATP-binding protein
MKKRAGLARALVLEPEILLFDEPDSGLDPVRTAFLNLLTLDLNQRMGPTIVIVTHHIDTARTVPDYIGLIFARKLIQFSTRKDMLSSSKPAVHQFLHGSTEGPIGMSEEKDAAGDGVEPDIPEETKELARRKQKSSEQAAAKVK